MIGFIRDNTTQTVFVAIHATIIVYGILVTATLLKGNGYPEYDNFFWFSKFVRHAGLLFFVIPAGWVLLTYWYDQSDRLHPTIFTVGTGFALILLLWWLFSVSASGTYRKTFLHEGFGCDDLRKPADEHGIVANPHSPRGDMALFNPTLSLVSNSRLSVWIG